ncbi:unnamed protein product [Ixodes persulcatus]
MGAQRFAEECSVKNKTHAFHVPPQKEKLHFVIVGAFEADPHLFLGRAARLFGVSTHTVRKAIGEIRPYKLGLIHEFLPGDYEKRLELCRDELSGLDKIHHICSFGCLVMRRHFTWTGR